MSQLPLTDETIQVKPQSNIYTLMMIITVLVLGVVVGLVMQKLMGPVDHGGYGMTFGEVFGTIKMPK
jgi:hypothetical protein